MFVCRGRGRQRGKIDGFLRFTSARCFRHKCQLKLKVEFSSRRCVISIKTKESILHLINVNLDSLIATIEANNFFVLKYFLTIFYTQRIKLKKKIIKNLMRHKFSNWNNIKTEETTKVLSNKFFFSYLNFKTHKGKSHELFIIMNWDEEQPEILIWSCEVRHPTRAPSLRWN